MSSSITQFEEAGHCGNHNTISFTNSSEDIDGHFELEEDDEDEDVDFNPFVLGTPSPGPSSSLSSENEDLGDGVKKNMGISSFCKDGNALSRLTGEVPDCSGRDFENEDSEFVMQVRTSQEGAFGEDAVLGKLRKRKSTLTSQPEKCDIFLEGCNVLKDSIARMDNIVSSGTDAAHEIRDSHRKHIVDTQTFHCDNLDAEDAICRRTRARYSLTNCSLDELEMFLQESDDSGQNVDDEAEYRKFLTAVLQGGDNEGHETQESANADDEGEENDADFEIGIEEALESDVDERTQDTSQKEKYESAGYGPETRQKKHKRASAKNKKKLLGHAKIPLRPLLPFISNAPMTRFPTVEGQRPLPERNPPFSSSSQVSLINGFTAHQIGQLHCLIHEHVQLLVQVFSLCVFEPSRQDIANEIQTLLLEMGHKRDDILSWRKVPYPAFCLRPPYIQPSVSCILPKFHQTQENVDPSFVSSCSSHGFNAEKNSHNMNTSSHHTSSTISSGGRDIGNVHVREVDLLETSEKPIWVPLVSGPVRSILDVAPLNLVGRYMTDVSTAVQEYEQYHVEAVRDRRFEREPLFPFPSVISVDEPNKKMRGAITTGVNAIHSLSPFPLQPKRTMAAALVESTMKQSIALVPKNISKLAERFFLLFNSALFPHKPPLASVANRVLFTDSEDELLAMGLMAYNTDWKAIQQRFLPCKSKHQIFVRQKNRCSSKAPENPIKAIRRMKTSPLTAEEMARIQEGLKFFKLDWMSIWKFIVPHRDPSLLPRQWRIALGIQKSYKQDKDGKAKRRLYESRRRKNKAASIGWQTDYEVENLDGRDNSADENLDDEIEAYVHEAFLADWKLGNHNPTPSELPCLSINKNDLQLDDILAQDVTHIGANWNGIMSEIKDSLKINSCSNELIAASNSSGYVQHVSHFSHLSYNGSYAVASDQVASDSIPKLPGNQVKLRPYRSCKSNVVQMIKLAPGLPPVNLPPSVRVISQSAFKSYHDGLSNSKVCGNGTRDLVSRLPHAAKSIHSSSVNTGKKRKLPPKNITENPCRQDPRFPTDQLVSEENGAESNLHMHPLLFQVPEDGCASYYPMNYSDTPTSSLFPLNSFQVDLNRFMKPQLAGSTADQFYTSLMSSGTSASLCTIDFHPLLQRTDNVSSGLATVSLGVHLSDNLEAVRGNCAQLSNPSSSVTTVSHVENGMWITNTAPTSPYEKTNELDLDIHLSSVTNKEKATGSRDRGGHNCNGSVGAFNNGSYLKTDTRKRVSNKTDAIDDHEIAASSNGIDRYTVDNPGDQSLPEIVMEQEELSDSDEEIRENVEFECEEMADSEGEGLDSDLLADVQNKEVQTVSIEEDIVINKDYDGQCRRPGICSPQNKGCVTKGSTHSRKSGTMETCKNAGSIELCSDSRAPPVSSLLMPKHENAIGAPASKSPSNALESGPGRMCKGKLKKDATMSHTEIQSTSAQCVTLTSERKPRRPICRTNSASNS